MKYIEGTDRNQLTFLPDCIEDYIDENNPVRVIDAFVNSLNMDSLGFERALPRRSGPLTVKKIATTVKYWKRN